MVVEKNKKLNKGEVTSVQKVANDMFLIKLKAASDFTSCPGQFISILCPNHTMRRPFSIMNFENNEISVLFKKKGDGTAFISSLKVGDTVDFLGAMGNGFSLDNKKTLLVGAGVGVAPVFYLKKVLAGRARLIAGFQNSDEIPVCVENDLELISTDDGSGKNSLKGSVLDYLSGEIEEYKPERICVCGPHIVLKLVAQMAKEYKIPCEVAMEKTMACSIGVCRGCVIQVYRGGEIQNAAVCKDGPVFRGEEVVW